MTIPSSPLALFAIACAAAAVVIQVYYLLRRPTLGHATRAWLFLGIGILPLGTAAAGNVEGFEATKERAFCGSCHVMGPHASDADDAASLSLSSRHARNPMFGHDSCYQCHATYGMFGTVLTKLGGMRHVWLYYTEYSATPLDEARATIHLRAPYPNANCMQCHSTRDDLWMRVPDHAAALEDVRTERVSCASPGCHGYAHPNFRPPAQDAAAVPQETR